METATQQGSGGVAHFVHVMKTGGTSFLVRARERFGVERVWPQDVPGAKPGEAHYANANMLRDLTPEERSSVRFFAGHHPFVATELSGAAISLTVLREPVERTVSVLRHLRRHTPELNDRTLEEIYDDLVRRGMFIWEYQVRQFAKRVDDDLRHIVAVPIDDAAFERAKENLQRVTLLGLHERYDEFERDASDLLGWPQKPFPRRQVSTDDLEVPGALRERIAADNPVDGEFYRYAVDLYRARTDRVA